VTLIEREGTSLNQSPVWTPSGDALFFISNSGGSRDIYQVRLSPSGTPAAPPLRLTTGLDVHTISLSSDGRRLAYSTIALRQNIWSLPVPDDGPVSSDGASPVTRGSQMTEGMDISADGEWIVFDSNRAGNQDIYKMRLDGGDPIPLTKDPADDFDPRWSPSGEEVVFYSARSDNLRDVYVMSADGGSVRRLTDQGGSWPDWSPDGQQIAFSSPRSGDRVNIYVSSRQGETQGETSRRMTGEGGYGPKWSPDGTRLAFNEFGAVPTDWFVSVVSLQSGEVERLVHLNASGHVAWSEDGRTIYYKAQESAGASSMWSVPASGGEPEALVHFDDPARPSMRREFAYHEERFYFTLTEYESDIWMMELTE
jgi:TolB protein